MSSTLIHYGMYILADSHCLSVTSKSKSETWLLYQPFIYLTAQFQYKHVVVLDFLTCIPVENIFINMRKVCMHSLFFDFGFALLFISKVT